MGRFGCVPAVRDVGLLVGCIYGHGRLVWVEQSDLDGKLILNSPVGSSAVPSSYHRFRPRARWAQNRLVGGRAPALSPPVAHASSTTSEDLCSWSYADRLFLRGS